MYWYFEPQWSFRRRTRNKILRRLLLLFLLNAIKVFQSFYQIIIPMKSFYTFLKDLFVFNLPKSWSRVFIFFRTDCLWSPVTVRIRDWWKHFLKPSRLPKAQFHTQVAQSAIQIVCSFAVPTWHQQFSECRIPFEISRG